jgi:tRNA(adenine34) deaminase
VLSDHAGTTGTTQAGGTTVTHSANPEAQAIGARRDGRAPDASGNPVATREAKAADAFHATFMRAAIEQAQQGRAAGEVPVGAVLVIDSEVVARAFNQPISGVDPTAHAEVLVLREAARVTGSYRLTGATVYVTLEPCLMCVGALVHARVREVVFGAVEPDRTGAGNPRSEPSIRRHQRCA